MAEVATQEDDVEEKTKEDTPEPEDYENNFDPFHVVAITGSYLGKHTNLSSFQYLQVSNNPNDIKNHTNSSTQHIQQLNKYQSKKFSKLNKALTSKKSKSTNNLYNKNANIANIWDRQYSSFCIAKNISYKSIENYAYSMLETQKTNESKEAEQQEDTKIQKDENIKCDIVIKCGGCYAVNSTKTSSLCDGYVLNNGLNKNYNSVQGFKLPSLEISRSNCSSVYYDKLGVICYGGRSNKKAILSSFEVLNIEENDFEWNTDVIPQSKESRSRHPSIGLCNDLLFICGGRATFALNTAECINLMGDELKWNNIASMNYARSFGSNILNWNRYNSVIVMGGYGSFFAEFYGEKYEINKNKWVQFPKCNFSHKYNPCIKFTKDGNGNELLVVICDKRTKSNLGIIEILDVR
eukprot:250085_1